MTFYKCLISADCWCKSIIKCLCYVNTLRVQCKIPKGMFHLLKTCYIFRKEFWFSSAQKSLTGIMPFPSIHSKKKNSLSSERETFISKRSVIFSKSTTRKATFSSYSLMRLSNHCANPGETRKHYWTILLMWDFHLLWQNFSFSRDTN